MMHNIIFFRQHKKTGTQGFTFTQKPSQLALPSLVYTSNDRIRKSVDEMHL